MWAHTVGVEVRVAGGGVDGVLLQVFTDVLRGGLREQPVQTLSGTTGQMSHRKHFICLKTYFKLIIEAID